MAKNEQSVEARFAVTMDKLMSYSACLSNVNDYMQNIDRSAKKMMEYIENNDIEHALFLYKSHLQNIQDVIDTINSENRKLESFSYRINDLRNEFESASNKLKDNMVRVDSSIDAMLAEINDSIEKRISEQIKIQMSSPEVLSNMREAIRDAVKEAMKE